MKRLNVTFGLALVSLFAVGCGDPLPVAVAGSDQMVAVGQVVQLDGSGSHDSKTRPLEYAWEFAAMPPGSTALLSGAPSPATAVNPSFVPDVAGEFIVRLTVKSEAGTSAPATVKIIAGMCGAQAPVAQIGILAPIPVSAPVVAPPTPALVLPLGATIHLDASTSSSVDNAAPCSLGKRLSYAWRFVSLPTGANARLNDPQVINPSFDVDSVGVYVVELVVTDDAGLQSAPVQVQINGIDPRQTVVGAGRSAYNSLVLDPTAAGAPRIAYYDANNRRAMIARCTANCDTTPAWTINQIEANTGEHISLAIDNATGTLFAAYYDANNNGRPRFAASTDHGATWTVSSIEADGSGGRWTSIAVGPGGLPAVAYRGSAAGNAITRYARCSAGCTSATPTWDFKTIDTNQNSGFYNSLAFDGQGTPAIAYRRDDNGATVVYAACTANCATAATSTWTTVNVDLPGSNNFNTNPNGGSGVSLAFTSTSAPYLAYRDDNARMLMLASCTTGCTAGPSAWAITVVDAAGRDCGEYPSLAISAAPQSLDRPRITYRDANNNELRFAYFEPTLGWQHTVLDQFDASFSSLKLTAKDGVRVSYSSINTRGLRYIAFGP